MPEAGSLRIDRLQHRYATTETTPVDVAMAAWNRAVDDDHEAWISLVDEETLRERAAAVTSWEQDDHPLYGVPFAVKDNIDAAGLETTAGCPAYAYDAETDATVVERLRAAGAILIGKTNLDQFATGLVGTRSPYGSCRNAHDQAYISGGSSAGSGVAVAAGQVSFALGTDTAGSGRVPAALNNVVGLKPTRGVLSTAGVVPACRTLDCVAVFALSVNDAATVASVASGPDAADPFGRDDADDVELLPGRGVQPGTVGVPRKAQREYFGHAPAAAAFDAAIDRFRALGWTVEPVDYSPFRETAELLYGGPWVAERLTVVEDLMAADDEALLDVTRQIISRGADYDATDTFEALYELASLRQRAQEVLSSIDLLATPTVPRPYTVEAVQAEPVRTNRNLGYYTNHVNLLEMAAVAVPTGFLDCGVPFGVTLSGPAESDAFLAAAAQSLHRHTDLPLGATAESTDDLVAQA